jgi:hypothetical protein
MSNQYPNSGALFAAKLPKRSEKAPDYNGSIDLDISLLQQLIQESEDGFSVKVKISGWKRQGTKGTFLSLKYDDYKPQAPRQAPRPDMPEEDMPF